MASQETARMENVIARLERIPFSFWHVKMRAIVVLPPSMPLILLPSYVLPVLIPLWNIAPLGRFVISTGYLANIWGCFIRYFGGKDWRLNPNLSVAILGFMSLACFLKTILPCLFSDSFRVEPGEKSPLQPYINELSRPKAVAGLPFMPIGFNGNGRCLLVGFGLCPVLAGDLFLIKSTAFATIVFALPSESPRWLVSHKRLGKQKMWCKG